MVAKSFGTLEYTRAGIFQGGICCTMVELWPWLKRMCLFLGTQDKLAKEEHNSVLNLNKINTQWRTVLREVKTRELHKDIEILSQTFERVVDCKDSVIKVSLSPKNLPVKCAQ